LAAARLVVATSISTADVPEAVTETGTNRF